MVSKSVLDRGSGDIKYYSIRVVTQAWIHGGEGVCTLLLQDEFREVNGDELGNDLVDSWKSAPKATQIGEFSKFSPAASIKHRSMSKFIKVGAVAQPPISC
jgi:hypothetical protein